MAEVVEPTSFATAAELVVLGVWFAAAVAPVVILFMGGGRNSADMNIYLRLLGLMWLGPMSVAIVGMGANYLRMVVDTFKAFRS